jgi:hypothetical protein
MHSTEKRHLHILLALLLLAQGVLTLLQGADHSLVLNGYGDVLHQHDHGRADMHHVAAIDGGTDEHGHHFHVHLPASALVSIATTFEYVAAPAGESSPAPALPAILTYAPPVPPPNA